MLTGQYVRTHGVFANGVALPVDAPSVAAHLKDAAGYRTALLGKAHFDPGFDLDGHWAEGRLAGEGSNGPLRGFDHVELAVDIDLLQVVDQDHRLVAVGRDVAGRDLDPERFVGAVAQLAHDLAALGARLFMVGAIARYGR